MKIVQLDQTWRGKSFLFRYTTSHYYDVSLSEEEDKVSIQMERKAFEKPLTKQFESSLLSDWLSEPLLFGAFEGNHLLGFVELSSENWNNRLRISNIWVEEEHRFTGIGKKLIDKVKEVAISQGKRALVLETQTCNDPAIRFYRSCGFRVIGCDLTHYSNDDVKNKEVRLEMGLDLEEKDA